MTAKVTATAAPIVTFQDTPADVRVLNSLKRYCHRREESRTIRIEVSYLPQAIRTCGRFASHLGVSFRDLDRALWQWHKETSAKQ